MPSGMRFRTTLKAVGLGVVASMVLAACGGSTTADSKDSTSPSSSTTSQETAPSSSAASEEPAASETEPATTDAGNDEKTIQVAFFAPSANSYVEGTLKGMQKIADAENAEITRFDTGFDAAKEYSQMQDAIAQQRFDAFIVIPLDSVGLVPVSEEAIKAGIALVNTDLALGPKTDTSDPQLEGQAGAVLVPPSTRGERISGSIARACEGLDPCNVGYIAGEVSLDFEQAAKKMVDELPSKHPNIHIVASQAGHGYIASDAIGVTQNMLQAHPEINVLMLTADQATLGAAQAVEDAGLSDKIRLVSSGGTCEGIQAVADGKWFSTIIDVPETEGELGMKLAIAAARGKPITPNGIDPVSALGRDAILTKDNLAGFECQYNG